MCNSIGRHSRDLSIEHFINHWINVITGSVNSQAKPEVIRRKNIAHETGFGAISLTLGKVESLAYQINMDGRRYSDFSW